MREELLPYYERELTFIRQMAAEFAEKYPKPAKRLMLEKNTCEDPHVERLIQAFALLCGRVHHKLDDEFPEIAESLMEMLYPHFLKPIPSQAIAQFELDPAQSVPASTRIPSGVSVHSRAVNGQFCSFRTCYPVTLWPLRVQAASVSTANRFAGNGIASDAAAVIQIEMQCAGGLRLSQVPIDSLRFYLNGDSGAVNKLYECLFLNVLQVSLRPLPAGTDAAPVFLAPNVLQQVGFGRQEGMLPYSDRSFLGYRLLQEYFTFPEKFYFFDLTGLDQVDRSRFGASFEILIHLKQIEPHHLTVLEQNVNRNTFALGCTPIVNLFERIAEPIRVSQTKTEYRVIPDQHRQSATEVYSIDRVTSTATYLEEPQDYHPFYALRHGAHEAQKHFWYAHRRPSFRKNDKGTETYISLVNLGFNPSLPPDETLTLHVTCTNRDQASSLDLSGQFGELEAEDVSLVRARCIRKPTATVRPPNRRGLQWRLISHLSLNHLSIVGHEALQEILRLYDFSGDLEIRRQIAGIVDVQSSSSVGRVNSDVGVTFCRGTDVIIEFDQDQYVGTGVFLLSSVLQRFLALYSAVNSFTRVTAKTQTGMVKQWAPMAGEQVLL